MNETKITFVIDTDEYSGNFEREMAAYIIGISKEDIIEGMCGSPIFTDDLIETRPVEHDGYYHPSCVEIITTPGWSNDGKGHHKKLKPGEKMNFVAFQSVGIFLSRKPKSEEVALLKARAQLFCETVKEYFTNKPYCKITAFRFITEKITTTQTIEKV